MLAVLLLSIPLSSISAYAAAQTPRAFLEAIYKHYVGKNTAGVKLDTAADYRRYFTPDLVKIIQADEDQAAKVGDVPALDGDPFIDAQDWEIAKIDIDVDDTAAQTTSAKIRFTNAGTPVTVIVDLVKIDGNWKIDDIHWPEDSLRGLYRH